MNDKDNMCEISNESQILDSGERVEFETGAVRDIKKGKGRCDLMPLNIIGSILQKRLSTEDGWAGEILNCLSNFLFSQDVTSLYEAIDIGIEHMYSGDTLQAVMELSIHFEQGAEKYGERNWEIGIPCHSYIDSGIRHLLKHVRGQHDEDHCRAFLWNMVCLLWTYINRPDMNDLPTYEYPAGDTYPPESQMIEGDMLAQ